MKNTLPYPPTRPLPPPFLFTSTSIFQQNPTLKKKGERAIDQTLLSNLGNILDRNPPQENLDLEEELQESLRKTHTSSEITAVDSEGLEITASQEEETFTEITHESKKFIWKKDTDRLYLPDNPEEVYSIFGVMESLSPWGYRSYSKSLPLALPEPFTAFTPSIRRRIMRSAQLHLKRPTPTPFTDLFVPGLQYLAHTSNVGGAYAVSTEYSTALSLTQGDHSLAAALIFYFGSCTPPAPAAEVPAIVRLKSGRFTISLTVLDTHTIQDRLNRACETLTHMRLDHLRRLTPAVAAREDAEIYRSKGFATFFSCYDSRISLPNSLRLEILSLIENFVAELLNTRAIDALPPAPTIPAEFLIPLMPAQTIVHPWNDFLVAGKVRDAATAIKRKGRAYSDCRQALLPKLADFAVGRRYTTAQLKDAGIHPRQITAGIKYGFLRRVAHGAYIIQEDLFEEFHVAPPAIKSTYEEVRERCRNLQTARSKDKS